MRERPAVGRRYIERIVRVVEVPPINRTARASRITNIHPHSSQHRTSCRLQYLSTSLLAGSEAECRVRLLANVAPDFLFSNSHGVDTPRPTTFRSTGQDLDHIPIAITRQCTGHDTCLLNSFHATLFEHREISIPCYDVDGFSGTFSWIFS